MSTFDDLAETLAELGDIPSRIAAEVADGITDEIRQQFEDGVDAYGNPWAPLLPSTVRRKKGDARILRSTDNLSQHTVAVPTSGSGIDITSVDYGGYHQGPAENRVARPILPDGGELPESWQDIIDVAAENAFKKALR